MSNNDDWLENTSTSADGTYSPDKFYTASRNKKGFGSTVRLNVPPEVVAHIAEILAARAIPDFKTSADFYRNALVHALHTLSEQVTDPVLSAESLQLRDDMILDAELARMTMIVERDKRTVDAAHNILQNLNDGNRDEMVRRIREILPKIKDPNLRDQLSRQLPN